MNDINEKQEPQTFEQRTTQHFLTALVQGCKDAPELKQVVVIFDWVDDLNKGAIACLIGNENGPLYPTQMNNVCSMLQQVSEVVAVLSRTLTKSVLRHRELCEQMETRLHEAQEQTAAQQKNPNAGEEETTGEQDANSPAEETADSSS